MTSRSLLFVVLNLGMISSTYAGLSAEDQKLVGRWEYQTEDGQVALQVFQDDGRYFAEMRKEGKLLRRFDGLWKLEAGMVVYTYTSDSLAQIPAGTEEKDKIIRVTEGAYTIEAGDHLQRTYFRAK